MRQRPPLRRRRGSRGESSIVLLDLADRLLFCSWQSPQFLKKTADAKSAAAFRSIVKSGRHYSTHGRWSIRSQCLQEGFKFACESRPPSYGRYEHRKANLSGAGGADNTLRLVKAQAYRVPVQLARICDKPADLRFAIGHQFLVLHPDHPARQHAVPMLHYATIANIGSTDLPKVVERLVTCREQLTITGKAGVNRVTRAVKDHRLREHQVNHADA